MIKVKALTAKSFAKYGEVIEARQALGFHVLFGEPGKVGWRLAYSKVKQKPLNRIEAHPDSMETFELVSGVCVMVVAAPATPDKIEAFILDKGVCIKKNTWHELIVLSADAELKLVENYDIQGTKYHTFKKPLDVYVG